MISFRKVQLLAIVTLIALVLFYQFGRTLWYPMVVKIMGKKTVTEAMALYGEHARGELQPLFKAQSISYPPKALALVAFKDSDILEVWSANEDEKFKLITSFPVKAASGVLGPKLVEGDRQVPEGLYKISGFNPNSAYHLSMKLNYPNEFDSHYAEQEGRTEPGTNIFIHGRASSVGCLAMGDDAIEQLFTLVHDTGRSQTQVLISPTDPSKSPMRVPENAPHWTEELYEQIHVQYQKINPHGAFSRQQQSFSQPNGENG